MIKPFLILQSRPEDEVADNEYEAIVEFGGIDPADTRRVRLEKTGVPKLRLEDYSAVIVGGGPYCISDDPKPPAQIKFEADLKTLMAEVVEKDFPFLGACYGLSILAEVQGGIVSKEKYSETVAATAIALSPEAEHDPLFEGIPSGFLAFGGHKESCQDVPPGATLLGSTAGCPVHIIRVKNNIYGTQFHPELEKVGLALRINYYKHKGYFPPEEAESLIAAAEEVEITEPPKILRRFVKRYSASG
jgi:GMP synthase (glutamine-hydrolysing)